ncbi:MAG: L7Ae/L30e/S12e/Gadd45 family ribosomal protein [Gemmatimonadaceae bacterium]
MTPQVAQAHHRRMLPNVDAMTERRLLGLVGLGLRARTAVVGVDRVRDAARRGRLALAIVAPDASRHSLDKVLPLLAAKHVEVVMGPAAGSLGAAVGRDSTATIGILDPQLARGMRRVLHGGRTA